MPEQLFSIWDMARAPSFAFAAMGGVLMIPLHLPEQLHFPISNRFSRGQITRLRTPKSQPLGQRSCPF